LFRLGSLASTPVPKPNKIQKNKIEFTEKKLHPQAINVIGLQQP
jgi:hypothetical protein